MSIPRRCSRTACGYRAVATLTYVYAEQTAVLGRLATFAEPHTYDLCASHAAGLTAPRGWQVVRLVPDFTDLDPSGDDLLALADAVNSRASNGRAPRVDVQRAPPPPAEGAALRQQQPASRVRARSSSAPRRTAPSHLRSVGEEERGS